MKTIRWSPRWAGPWPTLADLQTDSTRWFEPANALGARSSARGNFEAPVDLEETADAYILRADLPGVAPKDVKVSVSGETLVIRGQRHLESNEAREGFRHVERGSGAFERTVTFHAPVSGEEVQALVRDGVLEVRVPKAERARTREIDVQVGV